MAKITIIVSGASGYLGKRLVERFLTQDYKVIALTRRPNSLHFKSDNQDKISIFDISKMRLDKIFECNSPVSAVYNCAGIYGRNGKNIKDMIMGNICFPAELIENTVSHNVPFFFNVNTALPNNINVYSKTKHTFAELASVMIRNSKTKFIDIKMQTFYGSGQSDGGFIDWFISSCFSDGDRIPLTHGKQRRDFIHVMDVVDAMALLFEKSNLLSGEFVSVDLGSGKSVSMFEVANFIHSELNCNKELGFGDLALRENDENDLFADLKLLENFGWKPKIEIWDGLRGLLADVLRKDKY